MSTLNVKVPDEMDEDIEAFLEAHPHYLNKSELVRDALRHMMETPRLSDRTVEDDRVSRQQIEDGDVVGLEEL
ncbi:MAG: ribbon-helix-helix domain-containing protein [Halobaculum sp.]|jgi:Arc/MetJ-type ribon-helix-helix transcriptional regulator